MGRTARRSLLKVDLHEVGPCLVGANQEAQLVGVKSAALPPELIRTALDPAVSGEVPSQAQIDAEMKAIRAARPIQIASFPC